MKNLIAIILSLVLFGACNKDDDKLPAYNNETSTNEQLIFGHYYGQCIGEECVEIFKITSQDLFEDRLDIYAGMGPFNFEKLNATKFQKSKNLIDLIPQALLNESDSSFGCPDCADQGGLFIQFSTKSTTSTWRIDQMKSAIPAYLHTFVDSVNSKIQTINQ